AALCEGGYTEQDTFAFLGTVQSQRGEAENRAIQVRHEHLIRHVSRYAGTPRPRGIDLVHCRTIELLVRVIVTAVPTKRPGGDRFDAFFFSGSYRANLQPTRVRRQGYGGEVASVVDQRVHQREACLLHGLGCTDIGDSA